MIRRVLHIVLHIQSDNNVIKEYDLTQIYACESMTHVVWHIQSDNKHIVLHIQSDNNDNV